MYDMMDFNPTNKEHLDPTKFQIIPGDALTHTKLVMEALKNESFEVQMAGMLHDIGKFSTLSIDEKGIHAFGHAEDGAKEAEELLKRLKFSNDQIDQIVFAVRNHMKLHKVSEMNKSTLKRLVAETHFDTVKKVSTADVAGSNKDFSEIEILEKRIAEFNAEPKLPDPILTGKILISMGFIPGPQFKEILVHAMNKQLEGDLITLQDAREFVVKTYRHNRHFDAFCIDEGGERKVYKFIKGLFRKTEDCDSDEHYREASGEEKNLFERLKDHK